MNTLAKITAVGTLAALGGLGLGLAVSADATGGATEPGSPHGAEMMVSSGAGMRRGADPMNDSMPMSSEMANMHAAMPAEMRSMHEQMQIELRQVCEQMATAAPARGAARATPVSGAKGHAAHH